MRLRYTSMFSSNSLEGDLRKQKGQVREGPAKSNNFGPDCIQNLILEGFKKYVYWQVS